MYKNLRTKTALYIEDDSDVLRNITTLLSNYFATIFPAPTAEVALDIFKNQTIDLAIVDIELPGINGIEFIKKIRSINENIPIVIISSYTKTDYLLESIDLKIDKYIVKPFTSKKLYILLDKLDHSFDNENIFELTDTIYVDKLQATLTCKEEIHALTPKELAFLEILHQKKFIRYDDIDEIWYEYPPSYDAIRTFIKKLRQKLPQDVLKNRQNVGYYVQ